MTTHTRLSAFLFVALSAAACTSSTTPAGVLAINLRTGETRTFSDSASVPDGWATCAADMTCPAPDACSDLDESACIVRTDCEPVHLDSPSETPSPFLGCDDLTCTPGACGPEPESPTYMCDDGSVGGSTGRCLLTDHGCRWEFRDCPVSDCTPEECGPAPGAPAYMCDDGSWGGPGPCERNAAGVCGYTWRECPPAECTDADCGPVPGAAPRCSDGSTAITTCVNDGGVCGWQFLCPSCEPADCGPEPGALPMCGDGSSASVVCEPSASGVCGWQFLCPGE